MNTQVADLWVAALRSGKYTQCKNHLCKLRPEGECHCALGVLCEVFLQQNPMNGVKRYEGTGYDKHGCHGRFVYFTCGSTLPDEVVSWAGLKTYDPLLEVRLCEEVKLKEITYLNDDMGFSFDKIANLIEAQKGSVL